MKSRWVAVLLGVLGVLVLVLLLNFRGRGKIHDAPPLTPPSGESVARGAGERAVGEPPARWRRSVAP